MTSQCHDHYDIIVYSLINKEFLIKKFFLQFVPISFCLSDRNTYNPKIHRSFLFSHFQPNLFFKIFTMGKNSRPSKKTYFRNTSQAENRYREREEAARRQEEINKLRRLLTRALDQLAVHDTKVSRLEKELTLLSSSSENSIRSWQGHYHTLRESYLFLRRNIEDLRH